MTQAKKCPGIPSVDAEATTSQTGGSASQNHPAIAGNNCQGVRAPPPG